MLVSARAMLVGARATRAGARAMLVVRGRYSWCEADAARATVMRRQNPIFAFAGLILPVLSVNSVDEIRLDDGATPS